MLPSLADLMEYKHPQVVRAYSRAHGIEERRGAELFDDMLRFLWVSRKHKADQAAAPDDRSKDFLFVMHEEMRDIDNMWHNFILYTKDYTEFCHRYFGEYVHHQPDVAETIVQTDEEFAAELERYLSYVYDNLGEETVRRWFADHV